MTPSVFKPGDRVLADHSPGFVVYVRFAPPDYSTPIAYSVWMDKHRNRPGYNGSIWPACDVRAEDSASGTPR